MSERTFIVVASVIFSIVGLAHLLRVVFGFPLVIADWSVPVWLNGLGFLVAGALTLIGCTLLSKRS